MKKNSIMVLFFVIFLVFLSISCDTNLNPFTDTTWIHTSSSIANNIIWQTKQTLQFTPTEATLTLEATPSEGDPVTSSKTGTYTYTADSVSINFDNEAINGTVANNIITVVTGEKTQVFLKQ